MDALKRVGFLVTNVISRTPTYDTIIEVVNTLRANGLAKRGTGRCLSMSEVVAVFLKQKGIGCKLTECSLIVSQKGDNTQHVSAMVGFSDESMKSGERGSIDTHVVVVTTTTPSYLIDMSIGNRLPGSYDSVVIKLSNDSVNKQMLAEVDTDDVYCLYDYKQTMVLNDLHQRSIVDRIETDNVIFKQLHILKLLNWAGIALSLFAIINTFLNWLILNGK